MTKALYIMIGGFLGAGKSTAIGRLARRLTARGDRVGLITNDQGAGLVDTETLRQQGYRVAEIPGGCFCCRFRSLVEAAERLTAEARPQAFLAEPVGSCTDLVASVTYPLRRMYGESFRIAPLSVLVDPTRARRMLGLVEGRRFSEKVEYIYLKQLEEAEAIVVNKIDTLEAADRQALMAELERRYGSKVLFEVSAKSGAGLDAWFDWVLAREMGHARTMSVDYDVYAEGESKLGWLNATVAIEAVNPIDGNVFLESLMRQFQSSLSGTVHDIAHLKMTLSPESVLGEIALINLVRDDGTPEFGQRLSDLMTSAELVVNLRAEAPPEALRSAFESAIHSDHLGGAVSIEVDHVECFRPGRPEPTHRDTDAA